jgi:hypothetical protein
VGKLKIFTEFFGIENHVFLEEKQQAAQCHKGYD